jgi:hypothetical protein
MMVHRVRRHRDAIDEGDAVGKAPERVRLHQRFRAARPAGESAQRALNFEIGASVAYES